MDYHYNAADQIVWREEGCYNGGTLTSIHEHHYSYQGAQIALILDGNALPHNRYVWSPVDGSLMTDERASSVSGEFYSIYWAASDHLGTVGQLLDDTEKISEHREYDAFGAIDAVYSEYGGIRPTGLMQSDIAHAGRLWDNDADLYFNQARWYDPHTSRFLSEDPIQDGSNWYRYAGNDPINFSDPTGLSQAGNPLNNFYSGLGNTGPTYSAQQLFGGPTRSSHTQVPLAFPNAVNDSSISVGKSLTSQKFSTFANELGAAAIARTRAQFTESLRYQASLRYSTTLSSGPGLDQIVDFAFAELGNTSRFAGNTLGSGIEYATSGYGGTVGNVVAGLGGGAAQLARTAGNISAVIDLPRTVGGVIDDVGTTIDVGQQYGFRTAAARQIGLLQGAEAYYGTDVLSFQEVDVTSKTAEAFGRFGATAGSLAGPASLLSQPTIGTARRQAIRSALSNSNGRLVTQAERQGIKFTIREVEKLNYRLDGGIRYNGNQGIDLAFTGTGSNRGRFALAEAKAGASRSTLTRDAAGIRQGSRDFFATRLERAGRIDLRDSLLIDGNVDLFGGFARSQRVFQFNPDIFQRDINFVTSPNGATRVK